MAEVMEQLHATCPDAQRIDHIECSHDPNWHEFRLYWASVSETSVAVLDDAEMQESLGSVLEMVVARWFYFFGGVL